MSYRAKTGEFVAGQRDEIISAAVDVFNRFQKFGRIIVFVSGDLAQVFKFGHKVTSLNLLHLLKKFACQKYNALLFFVGIFMKIADTKPVETAYRQKSCRRFDLL